MNIDEIPTPKTDSHTLRATDIDGGGDFNAVHIQVAKDLERRLTIAREALRAALTVSFHGQTARAHNIIKEALTQTTPRP